MIASRVVEANGLRQHLLDASPDASAPRRETVLLLHGYLDLAESFRAVIASLASRGHRVIAPDFRGHGDTDRVGPGGYYHFADYLADVVALLDALAIERPHVVAHSMGGSVATMLAGTLPTRTRSLSLLEGVGPFTMPADIAPDRTAQWLRGVAKVRARPVRTMPTLDDVLLRMRASHPMVDLGILREMASRAVNFVDGGYVFKFDPLHQTTSPGRFDADAFGAFIDRIECPVLLVDGGDLAPFEDLVARAGRYPNARRVALEGAGHMMHWTRPAGLSEAVGAFLQDAEG